MISFDFVDMNPGKDAEITFSQAVRYRAGPNVPIIEIISQRPPELSINSCLQAVIVARDGDLYSDAIDVREADVVKVTSDICIAPLIRERGSVELSKIIKVISRRSLIEGFLPRQIHFSGFRRLGICIHDVSARIESLSESTDRVEVCTIDALKYKIVISCKDVESSYLPVHRSSLDGICTSHPIVGIRDLNVQFGNEHDVRRVH